MPLARKASFIAFALRCIGTSPTYGHPLIATSQSSRNESENAVFARAGSCPLISEQNSTPSYAAMRLGKTEQPEKPDHPKESTKGLEGAVYGSSMLIIEPKGEMNLYSTGKLPK